MNRAGTSDDGAWFEQLFRDTRSDVLTYLTRRTASAAAADAADAADLLAEVYLIAWRRRADLPEGRERLWLFGAARRLLAAHHRQRAGLEHLRQDWADHHDEQRSGGLSSSSSLPSSAADVVRAALDTLNELDQELITLTAWEQLSIADAARVVGMTATTARVRLHRARRRLGAHPDLLRLVEEGEPPVPEREHLRPVMEQH